MQSAFFEDAHGTALKEESGRHGADDGNAILDVAQTLDIAARQSSHVGEHGNGEGPDGAAGSGIVIRNCRRTVGGNKGDRGDGANVEATDVAFTTHVKAAIGG